MADNNKSPIIIGPFPFFPNFRFEFPNPLHRISLPRNHIVASDNRTVSSDDRPDAVKFTERKPAQEPPLQLEVDQPSQALVTYSERVVNSHSEKREREVKVRNRSLEVIVSPTMAAVTGKGHEEPGETKSGPFSFLPKFNLPNPFFNQAAETAKTASPSTDMPIAAVVGETEKEIETPKPSVVRFPNARSVVPLPMEVEIEESSHKTHNPVIIWQVYAMGGFLILKWVWARWNERKERAKKGSSSSSSTSTEENQSPEYQLPGGDED
ncbi:hypothetical protein LINPERHAP2_LOCUS29916 [Linum perenne]